MILNYVVEHSDVGKRLDMFILEKESSFSRSHIKGLIEKGFIKINNQQKKAGERLKFGDKIEGRLENAKPISLLPQKIDFEIVFEDADLLVINKPQGLVVHPGGGTREGTLVNGLLERVKDLSGINGEIRPGIVHRLDKNTSGLMLVAKNDFAHRSLAGQIGKKTCKRKYLALLLGVVQKDEGEIETFIDRSRTDRKKMVVSKFGEGRNASTHFRVVQRFERYTLCEFTLRTGRTHQIRVHAKHMGHPVVGDDVYGKEDKKFGLKGQLLHSFKIEFCHPRTNQVLSFELQLPDYFKKVLEALC
ncbi:MAG: RluA family pseudouridine synthase [Clostridia bacterium]